MGNTLLRNGVLFCLLIGASLYGFTKRTQINQYLGMEKPQTHKSLAHNLAYEETAKPVPNPSVRHVGSVARLKKQADGHFWADAKVNSARIKFLVDTGASIVALTPQDARKAGLRPNRLTYDVPMNTAAGQIMGARAELKYISVGQVTVKNVEAVIIPKGLTQSLLGMSYLGELQKVEASKYMLTLRR
ncbi:MAG: TIGR02281 family clan AA aspartic protease [Robiginitomaculum sp.]